jgi:Uri superfamily endonuclease
MKGVYVLIISVNENVTVKVGALGKINFEKGLYAYVGSAQTNLEKRVERHFRKDKRKFWHIDYLLCNSAAKIEKIFYKKAGKAKECEIAEKISRRGVAIESFGSSDCKCKSHLFRLDDYQFLGEFMQET